MMSTTERNVCCMSTSKLQPPQLKGDKAVANLNDMDEGIEVVGGHDETVTLSVAPPSPQQQVPTQRMLQRASQVLVKYRIQVVVVSTWTETVKLHAGERETTK